MTHFSNTLTQIKGFRDFSVYIAIPTHGSILARPAEIPGSLLMENLFRDVNIAGKVFHSGET